jgi:hypothetical protein
VVARVGVLAAQLRSTPAFGTWTPWHLCHYPGLPAELSQAEAEAVKAAYPWPKISQSVTGAAALAEKPDNRPRRRCSHNRSARNWTRNPWKADASQFHSTMEQVRRDLGSA